MHLWLSPHDARVRALGAHEELQYGFARTPFGNCFALMGECHLLALSFTESSEEGIASMRKRWPTADLRPSTAADEVINRLFQNPRSVSTDSSLSLMAIGTPFQLTVWEYLCSIPEGRTLTFGEVAKAIGRPTAARAVGRAVGANEIGILIPCHRVVAQGKSGGRLGGYRWGVERKKALLAWELSQKDPLEMPF